MTRLHSLAYQNLSFQIGKKIFFSLSKLYGTQNIISLSVCVCLSCFFGISRNVWDGFRFNLVSLDVLDLGQIDCIKISDGGGLLASCR